MSVWAYPWVPNTATIWLFACVPFPACLRMKEWQISQPIHTSFYEQSDYIANKTMKLVNGFLQSCEEL